MGLSLASAKIRGGLYFESLVMQRFSKQYMEAELQLMSAEVDADFEIAWSQLDVPLCAAGLKIGRSLIIIGCRCSQPVDFQGVSVGRNAELKSWYPEKQQGGIKGAESLLRRIPLVIHSLSFEGASFSGNAAIEGAQIYKDLRFDATTAVYVHITLTSV